MGLSKSERNILALLSMCRGISLATVNYYQAKGRQSKRLFKMLDDLGAAASAGLKLWTGQVSVEDYARLYALLEMFEEKTLCKDDKRVRVWTSATLSLVNDALEFVTNPDRLSVLQTLQKRIEQIHDYVDRKGTYYEDYEKADKAVTIWKDILENNWSKAVPSIKITQSVDRRLQNLRLQRIPG